MSRMRREIFLIDNGHAWSELSVATRRANIDRHRRRETVMNLKFYHIHEAWESVGRKLKRLVSSDKKDFERLLTDAQWRAIKGPP